jgi:hypothetical protein
MASPKQLAALAKARQALALRRQPSPPRRSRILDPAVAAAIFGLPINPRPRPPRTRAERLRHGAIMASVARELGFNEKGVRVLRSLAMREK